MDVRTAPQDWAKKCCRLNWEPGKCHTVIRLMVNRRGTHAHGHRSHF